jgi:uncharacterized cupredoxin-like copper-binding protein
METVMRPIRTAIFTIVIVAAVAGCAAVAAAPPAKAPANPNAAVSTQAVATPVAPMVAQSVAPVASVAPVVATPIPAAADPSISLYEWKVIAPATLKAGKTTFNISNFGTVPHELLMFKSPLAAAKYPVDAAGNIKEEGAGVDLFSDGENIDPSGSQARTVDLSPGTYLFVCNIPGHFKSGMFTVVTVTK